MQKFRMACAGLLMLFAVPVAQAAVTPGVDLEFNAASNPQDLAKTGAEFWYPSVDTLPVHDLGGPREYAWFGEGNTSIAPNTVADPSFPGITHSYSKGGSGRARDDVTGNGIQSSTDALQGWDGQTSDATAGPGMTALKSPDRSSATFEVWFKNNSLAGGEQFILEWGGGGRGAYISLENDEVSYFVNGDGNDSFARVVTGTIASSGWHQAVATLHNPTFDATVDDYISLYIDGVFVGDTSANLAAINDFSGGNAWGIGEIGVSNDPIGVERANAGPIALGADSDPVGRLGLDGEVAIVRYYYDQVLTPAEVMDNYNAVAATPLAGDFDNDGDVDGADFLEWQRTDGTPGGLADWQAAYPNPLAAASAVTAAVPEPGSFLLLALGTLLSLAPKSRQSRIGSV